MADIFLSYSREDVDRARRIEQALTQQGWTVFWDRELLPGSEFRRAIGEELDRARCVIVLWSRVSVHSEWVIDEAETGKQRHRLVSVVVDDVEPPLGFRQGQAADLVSWQGDVEAPAFGLLVRGVSLLAPLSPAPGPPPPEPRTLEPPVAPRPVTESRVPPWLARFAHTHPAGGPTLLLAAVFLVNVLETKWDGLLTPAGLGPEAGYPIADAFRWFERALSFEAQDAAGAVAFVGYSSSYFVIFPLLCLLVAFVLAWRRDPVPYRAVSLAVTIDYVVSLPFFIFFPVPERWSFPSSDAILLSDKLSESLIEMVRPISGLDNCFPSFHVSLTALVVTACFLFNVPLRVSALAFGASVILATFVLGIHWIPDMLAGLALGVGSMLLAWRVTGRDASRMPIGESTDAR